RRPRAETPEPASGRPARPVRIRCCAAGRATGSRWRRRGSLHGRSCHGLRVAGLALALRLKLSLQLHARGRQLAGALAGHPPELEPVPAYGVAEVGAPVLLQPLRAPVLACELAPGQVQKLLRDSGVGGKSEDRVISRDDLLARLVAGL